MVAIKPTRDFTSLNRVSYAVKNSAKLKQGKAINVYREEIDQGVLLTRVGEPSTSIHQYKENLCNAMGLGIGPRVHSECPFSSTADQFAATGSDALKATISAAYKQVLGNLGPMGSQRCSELESQLSNGDISVRDFVAGLAKSDLYKQNYFFKVSPIRGVELNYKHLLGRPPLNQAEVSAAISLIAEQGFDALVEKITHSGEYLEVFGTQTVPYQRAWTSEAGKYCSTFVNLARISPANAASDTIIEGRSQLVMEFTNARSISGAGKGYDVSGFVYSKATSDPTSEAFRRMYQSKNCKSWA
ncbi:phycobilisome rod-core linker polypeptide [Synechococcus sp. UW105]|uniref:phycobilisome rod-core linker polypeptide n=1 Tax=Synechococcus sp. UW105 TaxID=337067 RepID=UPI000E0EC97D|nr:phycobilisome rod-core linker polypeptide [Synechococcus sp. UW105]